MRAVNRRDDGGYLSTLHPNRWMIYGCRLYPTCLQPLGRLLILHYPSVCLPLKDFPLPSCLSVHEFSSSTFFPHLCVGTL
jgi:hypothetical protein